MLPKLAEMLDDVARSPAETAWVTACQTFEQHRQRGTISADFQRNWLVIVALDRCVLMGWVTGEQFSVLVRLGETGPPDRSDEKARSLWDSGIAAVEAEMNRMVFPPPAPEPGMRDNFFWGPRGTPFIDGAQAWLWTMDCLDARAENRRENSGLRIGRPCSPDDVVIAMQRLNLPATHARTVVAWGKRRDAPPRGSVARRYWDEAMELLTTALREKKIVMEKEPAPGKRPKVVVVSDRGAQAVGAACEDNGLPFERRRRAAG